MANKSGNFNDKKVKAQLEWATSSGFCNVILKNGIYYEESRQYDYVNRQWVIGSPVEMELQPIMLDNNPLTGFVIEKVQSRWSTNNKVFRIADPRGFELEVSAQNLLELMNTTVINHREVMDLCIWDFGKQGIGKPKLIVVK